MKIGTRGIKIMRIFLAIALLCMLAVLTVAQNPNNNPAAGASPELERELKALVRDMHDTLRRCDKERLFSFFAEDFVGTSYEGFTATKRQLMESFSCPPAEAKITRDLDDHKIRVAGDTVIVNYRVTEHVEFEGKKTESKFLYTDTFVVRDGRRLMISSQATRVLPERKAVSIDAQLLNDYEGRYASNPAAIFTIKRQGDILIGEAPNGEKVEFFAENETTFFAKGRDLQTVFERDKNGLVVRMIIKRGGSERRLDRIY